MSSEQLRKKLSVPSWWEWSAILNALSACELRCKWLQWSTEQNRVVFSICSLRFHWNLEHRQVYTPINRWFSCNTTGIIKNIIFLPSALPCYPPHPQGPLTDPHLSEQSSPGREFYLWLPFKVFCDENWCYSRVSQRGCGLYGATNFKIKHSSKTEQHTLWRQNKRQIMMDICPRPSSTHH